MEFEEHMHVTGVVVDVKSWDPHAIPALCTGLVVPVRALRPPLNAMAVPMEMAVVSSPMGLSLVMRLLEELRSADRACMTA